MKEKLIEKRYLYNGRILKLKCDTIELSNGKTAFREVIEHNGGASIIALDKDNNIYLVKQFRYPYNETTYEIPAGKIDINESHKTCAIRELKEETGLITKDAELIHVIYPTPAYCNEKIYIYYTNKVTQSTNQLDEGEILDCIKMPYHKALEMVKNNEIKDSKTIIAIYYLQSIINTK